MSARVNDVSGSWYLHTNAKMYLTNEDGSLVHASHRDSREGSHWGTDEVWVVDIMVDPWVHWGGEVWVDYITFGRWMLWERMRSGWTLSRFWPMDALGNG